MKIILLQDVRNIGRKGDVKEASDGYARNMLFPNKLAMPATGGALKNLEAKKAATDREYDELRKRLAVVAAEFEGKGLVFELSTDEHGSVFGSIGKEAILKALRAHAFVTTERVDVKIDRPIKAFGEHFVILDFKHGITAKLKIVVKADERREKRNER